MIFADSGFHLAVLNSLLDLGAISEDSLRAELAGIEPDEERYRIREAVSRLSSYELPVVSNIARIHFDGGNSIYMLIESALEVDTGGEADYYELGSLEGIEQLSALTSLNLDGHGYRKADLDLAPLAGHPKLATLWLSGHCINAKALESLPGLAKVDIPFGTLDDPTVLDRLAQRGVTVRRR